MNDHNLDDLIIDNINTKNSKSKSLLTIIALAIVVLIVAIILTKTLLKDPNEQLAINNESDTEMISPDLTLQNAIKEEVTQEKLSLDKDTKSKSEEITIAKKDTLSKVENLDTSIGKSIAETKVEEVKKVAVETTKPKTVAISQDIFEDETETSAETEAKEKQRALEQAKKIAQKKDAEEKARQKKAALKKKLEAQKKAKQKANASKIKITQKPKTQQKTKTKETSTTTQRGGHYYIQVGSFRQSPSRQFLSIIKKSGFNYRITPPSNAGTKKLLIGPYSSKTSANSVLPRVRDRINKGAFVVKK